MFMHLWKVLSESTGKLFEINSLLFDSHKFENFADAAFLWILYKQSKILQQETIQLLNGKCCLLVFTVCFFKDDHEKAIYQGGRGRIV